MQITVVSVGKIKEKYWEAAISEYTKRLSKYCHLKIIEVPDEKTVENASEIVNLQIREKEGQRILQKISEDTYVITLEIEGKMLSSEELSKKMALTMVGGISHITFVIGGSLGLSEQVTKRADFHLSFSKMTFPHQMMRVVLLEQIYRAFRIYYHEPYHK